MPTKDELRNTIELARELAGLAEQSAERTQGPYKKPTLSNIRDIQEVLDEGLDE